MTRRLDVALWRLPRWGRKIIVAPVALVLGVSEGFRAGADAARGEWRFCMNYVERGCDFENGQEADDRDA